MSGDLKYPDGIAEKILFDPIKEGADKLCILTAEATPSMASWLLKSYEELGVSDVTVKLIIGDTLRRWTKGYTIKQPNMDCQPTEITALMRHRAVFS